MLAKKLIMQTVHRRIPKCPLLLRILIRHLQQCWALLPQSMQLGLCCLGFVFNVRYEKEK